MESRCKKIVSALLLVMFPAFAMAEAGEFRENLSAEILAISVFNGILFVTSLISVIQFFLKDGHNRTPFQLFNIIFAILFYGLGLSFLLHHKDYFDGFGALNNKEALIKYFFDRDLINWIKLLIPTAVVLNIIYLYKNASKYYLE